MEIKKMVEKIRPYCFQEGTWPLGLLGIGGLILFFVMAIQSGQGRQPVKAVSPRDVAYGKVVERDHYGIVKNVEHATARDYYWVTVVSEANIEVNVLCSQSFFNGMGNYGIYYSAADEVIKKTPAGPNGAMVLRHGDKIKYTTISRRGGQGYENVITYYFPKPGRISQD